jgi:hypothetical protein
MSRKPYVCASGFVAAMVVLSGACTSNQGSPATSGGGGGQTQGGVGGESGQGGQTTGTGGNPGGAGGQSGPGGQSTTAGGSPGGSGGQSAPGGQSTAAGGSSGGAGGSGGQTTVPAGGGNLGSTGGTGQGGSTSPPDAAAGAGGSGGQGGDTTPPRADAADLAPAATGGSPGSDAAGDSAGDAAEPDASVSSHPRRVLLCDEGNRRILLVDLESPASAVWSTLVNDPNKHGDGLRDIQLVGGDRVAASTAKGYVEIDVNTGEIKKEVSSFSGVESLRRLPNGNTILGGNSDGGVTLQELDSQDAVVPGHKVTFTNYSQFRMFRRTPQGTFLMGVANKLAEVNWNKQSVWEMDFPAPAGHDPAYIYQGLRLPDNTIAVTAGYAASLLLVEPTAKKVQKTIGGPTQPEAAAIAPNFYAGYQMLANGHFVVTNWEGHGGGNGGKGIQLLEYDASGTLVWRWKQDPNLVSSLHHLIVLDGLDTTKLHDDVNGVLAPVTQ